MTIAISIPTYQRKDGTTPSLLSRTVESIKNQSYQDYKIFLIGDHYENEEEFIEIATSIIPPSKIYFENLISAVERLKYPMGSQELWCCGGITARNYAVDLALSQGYNYICPLDHDDYWTPDHLELIANVIKCKPNSSFVYTCGSYFDFYLPQFNTLIEYDGRQHHQPVYGVDQLEIQKKIDDIKTQYAIKNNIHLIRIPFTVKKIDIGPYIMDNLK